MRRVESSHFGGLLVVLALIGRPVPAAAAARPNVVLIVTDDQGYGELGMTGNPVVRTPHIDRLAGQSVSLAQFHVMPVCSPTRAGLMTGRDYYRTGLTDTWMGRSLMDPAEVTLGEMMRDGGYRTAIFGKWHLGDNYPRRPIDHGFGESLVLNGGGLAQPGDPPDPVDERGAYFNATLSHDGKWERTDGYVSDVITDAAARFIAADRARPFFVYLAFNCPHAPHQVPDEYSRHYPADALAPDRFPAVGHPMSDRADRRDIARVYGMVENIDDNVGRLLARLDELKVADDTVVVLMSDNGCQQHNGYNAGLRGWKGSPWEGGIRQFCFVHWPGHLSPGGRVDRVTSDTDLAPTLLDLCGVPKPAAVAFDGRSLAPLLRGDAVDWPDRTLVTQWHRGDAPERYRSCAVRTQDWKLVQPLGGGEKWNGRTDFQLYDMARDPLEMTNVAAANPARVAELKAAYDRWFDGVVGGRDFAVPQRIFVGAPQENPVLLTRQDWRGPKASWAADGVGYWELNVVRRARYDVKLRFDPTPADRRAKLVCAGVSVDVPVAAGGVDCTFPAVDLPAGPGRLEATLVAADATRGVRYAEVRRLD